MRSTLSKIQDGLLVLAGLVPMVAAPALGEETILPDTLVTASRLGEGVTGASTTVITADEIERSPGQTLQDVLTRQPGLQVQNLFGGVGGTDSTVDMRGFGAAATPNTLVLINGRRLNDIDLSGVDFSAIPRDSIERIEITRGNSGAVLYGDGAVGGVINIVTKNGFNEPPSYRAGETFGSFGSKETNLSAGKAIAGTALSVYGNTITADGYRDNNKLRQSNVIGEVRQAIDQGEIYLNLSADTQHLGLPGPLSSGQIASNPKGTDYPRDFADKQGLNAAFGATRTLADGIDLVVDAGVRHKDQQSSFYDFGFDSYDDRSLTTLSLTPRVTIEHRLFGLPGKAITGIDLYQSYFADDQAVDRGDAAAHRHDLQQRSLAGYLQDTVAVRQDTDLSLGLRLQNDDIAARDRYNPNAPNNGNFSTLRGLALNNNDTRYALHLGLDHRLTGTTTLFARVGHSFRLPTVDERVGSSPWGTVTNFTLKPQTSADAELGLRGHWGALALQSSAYLMALRDELHFSPVTFTNVNLDPTRRYGLENAATWQVTDSLRLKAGVAYTRAQFTQGAWKDREVPLVSRWTGTGGVSWTVWDRLAVFDADLRYVGDRRFDNDQANFQPMIPSHALVDVRIGGEAAWARYSLAAQNLFDRKYFDYGVASSVTSGSYNAYPMPGRTVMGRFGVSF